MEEDEVEVEGAGAASGGRLESRGAGLAVRARQKARVSLLSRLQRERKRRRTSLVANDRVEHDALGKLVRLAAAHDGDALSAEHHGDHGGAGAGEHGAVREEGVGAEEAERDAREDERERGEEDVGRRDGREAERVQEVLACAGAAHENRTSVSVRTERDANARSSADAPS